MKRKISNKAIKALCVGMSVSLVTPSISSVVAVASELNEETKKQNLENNESSEDIKTLEESTESVDSSTEETTTDISSQEESSTEETSNVENSTEEITQNLPTEIEETKNQTTENKEDGEASKKDTVVKLDDEQNNEISNTEEINIKLFGKDEIIKVSFNKKLDFYSNLKNKNVSFENGDVLEIYTTSPEDSKVYLLLEGELKELSNFEKLNVQDGIIKGVKEGKKIEGVLEIPADSIKEIGEDAFSKNTGITEVRIIPSQKNADKKITIGKAAFFKNTNLTKADLHNVENIMGGAFFGNENLREVNMPDVKLVDEHAFYKNVSLTSLDMPKVESIGEGAFAWNINLVNVDMPLVKTIGKNGFGCNPSLVTVNMPLVETIGEQAFFKTTNLGEIKLDKIKKLDKNAFLESGVTKVTIASDVELPSIGFGSFSKCKRLESINIPDSVKVIEEFAFSSTESLANIDLNKVETVKQQAFSQAKGLENVNMPEVKVIELDAFIKNDNLTTVSMPKVERIDEYAFYLDKSIKELNMPVVKTIGKGAFAFNTSLVTVDMPLVETISETAFSCNDELTTVNMPNVKTIGFQAFFKTPKLEEVNLPNIEEFTLGKNDGKDDKSIYSNAFNYSGVTKVALGDKIKTISLGAFDNTTRLKTIDLNKVETLKQYAFSHSKELRSVVMPNVKTVEWDVFANSNNLEKVIMQSKDQKINVMNGGNEPFDKAKKYYIDEFISVPNELTQMGSKFKVDVNYQVLSEDNSKTPITIKSVFIKNKDGVVEQESVINKQDGQHKQAFIFDTKPEKVTFGLTIELDGAEYSFDKEVTFGGAEVKKTGVFKAEGVTFRILDESKKTAEAIAYKEGDADTDFTKLEEGKVVIGGDDYKIVTIGTDDTKKGISNRGYKDQKAKIKYSTVDKLFSSNLTQIKTSAFAGLEIGDEDSKSSTLEIDFSNINNLGKEIFRDTVINSNVKFIHKDGSQTAKFDGQQLLYRTVIEGDLDLRDLNLNKGFRLHELGLSHPTQKNIIRGTLYLPKTGTTGSTSPRGYLKTDLSNMEIGGLDMSDGDYDKRAMNNSGRADGRSVPKSLAWGSSKITGNLKLNPKDTFITYQTFAQVDFSEYLGVSDAFSNIEVIYRDAFDANKFNSKEILDFTNVKRFGQDGSGNYVPFQNIRLKASVILSNNVYEPQLKTNNLNNIKTVYTTFEELNGYDGVAIAAKYDNARKQVIIKGKNGEAVLIKDGKIEHLKDKNTTEQTDYTKTTTVKGVEKTVRAISGNTKQLQIVGGMRLSDILAIDELKDYDKDTKLVLISEGELDKKLIVPFKDYVKVLDFDTLTIQYIGDDNKLKVENPISNGPILDDTTPDKVKPIVPAPIVPAQPIVPAPVVPQPIVPAPGGNGGTPTPTPTIPVQPIVPTPGGNGGTVAPTPTPTPVPGNGSGAVINPVTPVTPTTPNPVVPTNPVAPTVPTTPGTGSNNDVQGQTDQNINNNVVVDNNGNTSGNVQGNVALPTNNIQNNTVQQNNNGRAIIGTANNVQPVTQPVAQPVGAINQQVGQAQNQPVAQDNNLVANNDNVEVDKPAFGFDDGSAENNNSVDKPAFGFAEGKTSYLTILLGAIVAFTTGIIFMLNKRRKEEQDDEE